MENGRGFRGYERGFWGGAIQGGCQALGWHVGVSQGGRPSFPDRGGRGAAPKKVLGELLPREPRRRGGDPREQGSVLGVWLGEKR